MVKSQARGGGAIQVRGLKELQAALREVEATLPRELRKTNKDAAELIASRSRARASSLGGAAKKSAPSIKAAAEQRFAKLSFGGNKYPFAPGANFGAQHDIARNTRRGVILGWNQFPGWGGNQFTGGAKDRFIYWTLAHEREAFKAEYERLLGQLARTLEESRR